VTQAAYLCACGPDPPDNTHHAQLNLINQADIHRRGDRPNPDLTEKEQQQIRAIYDKAVRAAHMACPGEPTSGFTEAYQTALGVEIQKRWPAIERLHRKAERRRRGNHPLPPPGGDKHGDEE
jgi:hypothetical protein